MKKSLVAIVVIAILFTLSVSFAAKFSDVDSDMWAVKQIERWADEKIVVGYEDGTYRPSNFITRAEFATIVVKLFGPTKEADLSNYNDVSKSDWYYENLSKAVAMGSIENVTSNTMKPNAYVTRQEAVVILNSVLKLAPAYKDAIKDFADYDEIADYAEEDVEVFSERGYVIGYPDGTFRPDDTITRAEAATILDRIFKMIITEPGTYDCTGIGVNNWIIIKSINVKLTNADQVGGIIFLNDTVKKSTTGISDNAKKVATVINPGANSDSKTTGRTSSGGSSGSKDKIATFNIKKNGNEYSLTRNGVSVQVGRRLKITVAGYEAVNEIIADNTDLFAKLKIVAEKMNDNNKETQRIINTLDRNRFGFTEEVENWGTATITRMALEDKADLKVIGGNVHNFDIGDVYNALSDEEKAQVFGTAMQILEEKHYTNAQIIDALNSL